MRYLRKWQLAAVCLLALALLPFVPAPRGTAQAPGYTVTDLGALGTGNVSRAFGLNECGKVVGESSLAAGSDDNTHPFLWSDGVMIDLGTLGGSTGTATAVNQAGTVVGSAHTSGGVPHAFFWRDLNNNGASDPGEMKDLGSLGGFTVDASDINNLGQVVGQSETTANGNLAERAFIWQDENNNGQSDAGEMKMLTAAWGTPIRAFGINDAGQVVGVADRNVNGILESHAYVTIGGVAVDLGTLGGTVSFAHKVNDLGEVAGHSHIPGTSFFHAVRWKDLNGNGQRDTNVGGVDEMQDLGTLGTGRHSFAYDLNDSGLVVGKSEFASNSNATRAFVWSSANGMQDLNALVPGTNWTFRDAQGINDRGQIVGTGLNPDGKLHAFLLTPTNDPGPPPACSATPTPTPTPTPSPGTLQFGAATYSVGENGGSVVISVSRENGDDGTVTVNYATSNGTATEGVAGDYLSSSGTLTFNQDETSKTFSITINDDATDEPNETVNLSLSAPGGGATLGSQTTAVLTINDNDATPTVSVGDASAPEGNSGTADATFAVTLSAASGQTVTVNYATAPDTGGANPATAGTDYNAASGSVTFNPGETSKNVTIAAVIGDTTDEPNETFLVNLSSPVNATINDGTGVINITDDDGPPALSISDVTVIEGNSGTTNATFTVSLLPASGQTVTVNYVSADGTATQPGDYAAASGTLTFDPGQTSKTIDVTVNGDTLDESNETFFVNLSGESNAAMSDSQGQGTITNDEAQPTLQFSAPTYSVGESGEDGNGKVTITVTRTGGTNGGVTVNYSTTTGGTATAGSDYTAISSGTLTFAEGDNSESFTVSINNDALDEPNETINLALSSPVGGALGSQTTAVLTINDDDVTPSLSINDVTVSEGNAGTTTATFNVILSTASGQTVTVNYATADGTAAAGSDYTAVTSTQLSFAPGETEKTFNISVMGDTLDEPDENFSVILSGPSNATVADGAGVGTITDDDAAPTLSVNDVTVAEGNGGTATAAFNVTLSDPSALTVTVNVATSDGTATADSDYTAVTTTLTFNPGQVSQPVNVSVLGDTLNEASETFNVTLSGAANATISDGQGVGTINDNDGAPSLSINDVEVVEGNAGTASAAFTVKLSAKSGQPVTVSYATANDTATAGSDYAVASGTLTFDPGQDSKTIQVTVSGDTLDEPDETFLVNLSSPSNATVSDTQGQGTIKDDDGAPSLSINDAAVTEGNSGNAAATFTVTLLPASGQTVTVRYDSADGTANAGPDYGGTAGTLSFAPGETTKTITVNAFGDTFNEPNETFFVNLSAHPSVPLNATIVDAQGQGTINNDDTPTLRFSQAAYPAGESAHFVTVTVTRAGDASQAVGVSFATSDGTASQRRDYTAVSGRLQFAAGETSKTFDVLLTVDAYEESVETVNLTLSNPTGGAALGGQSTATVNIADTPPPGPNPIDIASDFVRQHYHDFLSREPDAAGLAFWTDQMTNCGSPNLEVCRINVSAAFFQAIEFQQTGYLVYRTYKAAHGDATSVIPAPGGGTETISVPVVRLQEFLPDTRSIGLGVQVGIGDWEQRLEANKQSYMAEFVQRQRFLDAYSQSLTAAEFVDRLNQNAGGVLSQTERDQLASDLASGAKTRAQALRAVAEHNALQQAEFRRAFVLMQFYGYLRRNPDDPQDVDFRGWKFWLDKLNQFDGNFVEAEMVKAFLDSIEYRTRFAP